MSEITELKSAHAIQNDEAVPAVSFDIRLGKKYKWVDFDYDAYRKMIEDMDGTQEDYENAVIKVGKPNPIVHGDYSSPKKSQKNTQTKPQIKRAKFYQGSEYRIKYPRRGSIRVFTPSQQGKLKFKSLEANRILAHESRHYLDDRHNIKLSKIKNSAGIMGTAAFLEGVAVTLLGLGIKHSNQPEFGDSLVRMGLWFMIGGMALYGVYGVSKQERSARLAARQHGQNRALIFTPISNLKT